MEMLIQVVGPVATSFLMPFAFAAVVLVPFAAFIFVARKIQESKMKTLLEESDKL